MKLSIRYADKIVGVSVLLALGVVVFVVFMLGVNQRWFARDYVFFSYLDSAAGLSQNMPVQHVGFTIGFVRSFEPTEDELVRVRFVVFDTYIDRARVGSSVELVASPIPVLGNFFLFHPGPPENELLEEGSIVPGVRGYDSIGAMLGSVETILYVLADALVGSSETELGRIVQGVGGTIASVQATVDDLVGALGEGLEGALAQVDGLLAQVDGLLVHVDGALANVVVITDGLADPDGAVMAILDGEGDVYASLVATLDAVSGILYNLRDITGFIPAQFPQIVTILMDLQDVMRTVDDVLIAVANNPLLRGGLPTRVETGPGGTAWDMEF